MKDTTDFVGYEKKLSSLDLDCCWYSKRQTTPTLFKYWGFVGKAILPFWGDERVIGHYFDRLTVHTQVDAAREKRS